MESKSLFSLLTICFCSPGLSLHRSPDHISFLFFKMVSNVREVNPHYLPMPLSDGPQTSQGCITSSFVVICFIAIIRTEHFLTL
jgi:hypothetical protein